MILPLITATLLHSAALQAGQTEQQGEQVITKQIHIDNPDIAVYERMNQLDPMKESPKEFGGKRWLFPWLSTGFGSAGGDGALSLRVRVYSQERHDVEDKAPMVARMVMQIWDRAFKRLRLDSPLQYNGGIVDYYLCFQGTPGGEQLLGEENIPGKLTINKVNTVYIYQLSTFKDPVEMAREVAHEYGHAILPTIGGFKQPEDWASGYLGEKLFLTWIQNDMAAGKLTPDDAMGASAASLGAWLSKNVDPLVKQAALTEPAPTSINEVQSGMDEFNGLAMYIYELCPPSVFIHSLLYEQDAQKNQGTLPPPVDYPQFVVQAASEVENLTLSVPKNLMEGKQSIWIPLGKGKCTGATVLTRKNGWAKVMPLTPNIIVRNPPIG